MIVNDYDIGGIRDAAGDLTDAEREIAARLVDVLAENRARNDMLAAYYGGDVALRNIGIAVPDSSYVIMARDVKAHCDWPAIAVDRLAERSMFDGFTFAGSASAERDAFRRMADDGMLARKYRTMLPMMLVHGCAFWTVGRGGPRMPAAVARVHTASSASALWDGSRDRILAGLAITGTGYSRGFMSEVATRVDVHTSYAVIEFSRAADAPQGEWTAVRKYHPLGRPLMEPFSFNADERWRFGHSRISRQVRAITDSMMRESFRCEVAAEINVLPQKYVAGLTPGQFEDMMADKFGHAIGSMLLVEKADPEDPSPAVGQFPQASLQPHIDMKRDLAADFSGITGIPMSQLGVTHDNPSSAEAIEAAERPLVNICERMNDANADGLRAVALMMMAVAGDKPMSELTDGERSVSAHFLDPSMPSASAMTDRAIKIASVAPGYADTEQFWIDVGKDESERRRIMSDLRRSQARLGAGAILDRFRQVTPDANDAVGSPSIPGGAGR